MEKNERTYTTLHNHTHYSNLRLIDSINTEETLIDRAYELGLKGVAITDHESVSGHIKALNYYNKKYTDEQKEDFKLILGNEIYLTRSTLNSETHQKGEKFYHLLLLAKDAIGHEQLRQLSSKAWNRAYYRNMMRTPTFMEDLHEVVKANSGHLICSTACLGSYPAQMFLMNELEAIDPFLQSMVDVFGKDNFFIEIQPSMNQNQIDYNSFMIINFWQDYNFIFTTDSHYLKKEDQEVHRLYLQSKSGATREVDEYYGSAYLMDYEEVKTYFDFYISMPKIEIMKNNTNKINNMITSYSLNHGQIVPQIEYENRFDNDKLIKVRKLFEPYNCKLKYKYLDYYLNTKDKADSYLINLILEGYSDKLIDIKDTLTVEKRMERLDYELEQIHETSLQIDQPLADYFITMSKMIDIIWNEAESLVGPGRGSASGFLINYLIGITQIDPMTQELYMPPWRLAYATHMAGYKSCIGLLCMATCSK